MTDESQRAALVRAACQSSRRPCKYPQCFADRPWSRCMYTAQAVDTLLRAGAIKEDWKEGEK